MEGHEGLCHSANNSILQMPTLYTNTFSVQRAQLSRHDKTSVVLQISTLFKRGRIKPRYATVSVKATMKEHMTLEGLPYIRLERPAAQDPFENLREKPCNGPRGNKHRSAMVALSSCLRIRKTPVWVFSCDCRAEETKGRNRWWQGGKWGQDSKALRDDIAWIQNVPTRSCL